MNLLDNPVWNALHSVDKHFNKGTQKVSYFSEEVSPFVGLPDWSVKNQKILASLQLPARSWSAMIATPIYFSEEWEITFTTTLFQMVCRNLIPTEWVKNYRLLKKTDVSAMLTLTKMTKPGPFLKGTHLFGNYYGIFEDNLLVAMAGERLHLNGYTEISAVCTHPDFTGRGYAAFLVSRLADEIIKKKEIPFLHVKNDNRRAIQMYERLGFEKRMDMYFSIFKKR